MHPRVRSTALVLASVIVTPVVAPGIAAAQTQPAETADPAANAAGKVVLLFNPGSDALTPEAVATLDKVSRVYHEAHPIIMIVSGGTDSVGDAAQNLLLSQRRANSVARGLIARGVLPEQTQIFAKGESSPAVDGPKGKPEPQNRRVEIAWR